MVNTAKSLNANTMTPEQAVQLANEIKRLESVVKTMKDDLKKYVEINGAVETDDAIWDFNISESWKIEPESLREMAGHMVADGKNPWEIMSITAANIKKLGWNDVVLEKFGQKRQTRRFTSRKK